ncbi:MAG: IS5 family transposase [Gammaproteobacteria bacterium]|jgi:IS5 family transposase
MRETRSAQSSLFDWYSEHDKGQQLKALSDVLDQHPNILALIERELRKK